MATSIEYIEFVCEQIKGFNSVRYKKMFGEYMVYINDKPVLLVCDNTVYIKKQSGLYPEKITEKLNAGQIGYPYNGAKEHYILDMEDNKLVQAVIEILEQTTPIPKSKKIIK